MKRRDIYITQWQSTRFELHENNANNELEFLGMPFVPGKKPNSRIHTLFFFEETLLCVNKYFIIRYLNSLI